MRSIMTGQIERKKVEVTIEFPNLNKEKLGHIFKAEEELRKALTERFSNVRQKRLREFQQFGKIQSKDFELSAMRSSAGNFKSQDNF